MKWKFLLLSIFVLSVAIFAQTIDLWVMSQCPYGAQAKNVLYQVLMPVGARFNLPVKIHYILNYDEQTGEFHSLHGNKEVEEDVRQMIIQKYFPDKFWCYLISRNSHFYDSLWVKDARICGLDVNIIGNLMETDGYNLAIAQAKITDSLGIDASPTLFIDGVQIRNWAGDFPSLFMMIRSKWMDIFPEQALPQCIDDNDCIPESNDYIAYCENGKCISELAPLVKLTIILPDTTFGNVSRAMIKIFQSLFPKLSIQYVEYDSKKGKKLVKLFGVEKLPAYIFDSDIQNDRNYSRIKENLLPLRTPNKLWYMVKPEMVEISYYLNRPEKEYEIAIFVMSDCPFSVALEESLLAIGNTDNITLHYIVQKDSVTGEFKSLHGEEELDENRTQIVIQKYFPDKFWEYLSCANESDFSDTCITYVGINTDSLQKLVELYSDSLLSEDAELCENLGIFGSPTVLWQNRQIVIGNDNLNKLLDVSVINGKCQEE